MIMPCMNCNERHRLCHNHCEKYLAVKREQQAIKQAKSEYYRNTQPTKTYFDFVYSRKRAALAQGKGGISYF